MLRRKRHVRLDTERLLLRLPQHGDFRAWVALRAGSADFLKPWEPSWAQDHLTRKNFTERVYWAGQALSQGNAVPFFILRRRADTLLGAITLDHIRRGPAQAATLGYWIGQVHARQGYMHEAIKAVVHYGFRELNLGRIEAACLPENVASRGVLEKSGFKYEGVAQSYLQINGRWRNHVLYANLRHDRRGRTDVR